MVVGGVRAPHCNLSFRRRGACDGDSGGSAAMAASTSDLSAELHEAGLTPGRWFVALRYARPRENTEGDEGGDFDFGYDLEEEEEAEQLRACVAWASAALRGNAL